MESTRNAVGLILVALLGGCSLSLSGPASQRTRGEVPRCDTGKGPVALDALGAAVFGIGGLAAVGANDGKEAGAVMLGASALLALSAIRGDWKVSACRAAFDEYAQEGAPQRTRELARMPDAAPAVAPPVISPKTVPSALPGHAAPATRQPDVTPLPSTPAPKPVVVDKPTPKQPPKPQAGDADWSQFWQEQP